MHLLHRYNGYLLLAALVAAAWTSRRDAGLRPLAFAALAIGIAQIGVGIANVIFGLPVEVTGLHSALATALAVGLTLALREVVVRARPAERS